MAGRNISLNLRRILDTIDFMETHQIQGVLISVDFMKAFDRVEYVAVKNIMKKFGYGDNIIDWTMMLFNDMSMSTLNNGYTSGRIKPSRGLLQGNPIASYIFLLVIETLAVKLRANKKIKGIKVGNTEQLLAMFADDLALLLEYNQKAWDEVVCEFRDFEKNTGMLINYEKSTVYRIGSLHKTNARFYSGKKLQWTNEPVKILGVYITVDNKQRLELNILKMWEPRGISLIGKITVINTLIGSLFTYRMSVIPALTKEYIDKINKMCTKFIWNNKKAKISMNILQGLKTQGGAGLTNICRKRQIIKNKLGIQSDCRCKYCRNSSCNVKKRNWKSNLAGKNSSEAYRCMFSNGKFLERCYEKLGVNTHVIHQ